MVKLNTALKVTLLTSFLASCDSKHGDNGPLVVSEEMGAETTILQNGEQGFVAGPEVETFHCSDDVPNVSYKNAITKVIVDMDVSEPRNPTVGDGKDDQLLACDGVEASSSAPTTVHGATNFGTTVFCQPAQDCALFGGRTDDDQAFLPGVADDYNWVANTDGNGVVGTPSVKTAENRTTAYRFSNVENVTYSDGRRVSTQSLVLAH